MTNYCFPGDLSPTLLSSVEPAFVVGLTDICAAGIVTQSQHGADSLGVGLLNQKLDDCRAISLDQILALGAQSGGQNGAHLLHSLNHFFLQKNT